MREKHKKHRDENKATY